MAKVTIFPTINPRWLEVAFWIAGTNWTMWRSDFEYVGPYNQMPVLADQNRFLTFVSEYSLFQRQTRTARLCARTAIIDYNLRLAFGDSTGMQIDLLAQNLQSSSATLNEEPSLLSKLAAFAEPGRFNAYDESARKGLRKWTPGFRRGNQSNQSKYQTHCTRIDIALAGALGQRIGAYLAAHTLPTTDVPGFTRRVLDVYLMIEGGRWSTVL